MGQKSISQSTGQLERRRFARALLDDLRALERMCEEGMIRLDCRRVGAEQEMFVIDRAGRPAPLSLRILEQLDAPEFTTELGLFNMEYNVPPDELAGGCLRALEERLTQCIRDAREVAGRLGGDVLLAGILPSIEQADLGFENITPLPRYFELNRVMTDLSGGTFRTVIDGIDDLQVTHDSVMLEACNTSFQVHFQVSADEFARLYNLAQVVSAPVLAVAANSPLLLQHRLWRETRIALFEQSLDFRSDPEKMRGQRRRVSFGDRWVDESVVELFREDVARFRVLLAGDLGDSSMEMLARGEIPPLTALCLHNGTIYRWNRPCFGVRNGTPHLRIENRALPSGPTVLDEVANAAFYYGLMSELAHDYGDVRDRFTFEDAKANFFAAARHGLKTTLRWVDGEAVSATLLITEELLPKARQGLQRREIDEADIDRYLGVVRKRVETGQTGAQWALTALQRFSGIRKRPARYQALTRVMAARQRTERPVHEWALPTEEESGDWRDAYRTVGQVMTTDLFTIHPDDLVDIAASVMHWEHLRHVPVEDHEGNLVGLISHRSLLKMIARGAGSDDANPVAVREIMRPDPVTTTPETSTLEAIELMRTHKVGCLPVVREGRLVGVVSERDFINISARLLEEELKGGRHDSGGR